jgi:hypothetical protein
MIVTGVKKFLKVLFLSSQRSLLNSYHSAGMTFTFHTHTPVVPVRKLTYAKPSATIDPGSEEQGVVLQDLRATTCSRPLKAQFINAINNFSSHLHRDLSNIRRALFGMSEAGRFHHVRRDRHIRQEIAVCRSASLGV